MTDYECEEGGMIDYEWEESGIIDYEYKGGIVDYEGEGGIIDYEGECGMHPGVFELATVRHVSEAGPMYNFVVTIRHKF